MAVADKEEVEGGMPSPHFKVGLMTRIFILDSGTL